MFAEFLNRAFDDGVIVGNSNKPHKFENIVLLPNGRRLIIDPAVHEFSSMNARIVANLDVRAINDPAWSNALSMTTKTTGRQPILICFKLAQG